AHAGAASGGSGGAYPVGGFGRAGEESAGRGVRFVVGAGILVHARQRRVSSSAERAGGEENYLGSSRAGGEGGNSPGALCRPGVHVRRIAGRKSRGRLAG